MFETFQIRDKATAAAYAQFAARTHHELLADHLDHQQVVLVGAHRDDLPIGLLICLVESLDAAQIVSVYVRPEHRRAGLASQMFTFLESLLKPHGVTQMLLAVNEDADYAPIQAVTTKLNWYPKPKPIRSLWAHCTDSMKLPEAPVVRRALQDSRLQLFPWQDLTDAEWESLKRTSEEPDCWFPESLGPLADRKHLYMPACSGLRFEGQVIGWALCHRFLGGPVIVSRLFAKPIPEAPMAGILLLQAIAKFFIHEAKNGEFPARFTIVEENKFNKFIERQFLPYVASSYVSNLLVFRKEI